MPRPSRWDDIVQAAAEEFRDKGYDAATLEGIAMRVGLLKGSLYHYIETKEDLLFAVVELPAVDLLDRLETLVADPGPAVDRLRAFFHLQLDIFDRWYPAAFVYLQQLGRATHRERFRLRDERLLELLAALLADGERRGEFALSSSTMFTARWLLGSLGWMQHWYVPKAGSPASAVADRMFSLALGGLLQAGPASHLVSGRPIAELNLTESEELPA